MGKLYGVLGHPVGHSMSPLMHNDAFRDLGLPHHYQAFDVDAKDLGDAIRGIKALGISGFNVTIPHKVAVMNYLDEIDDEAKEIQAVNTVKNENGKLIGYNTDGSGYYISLAQLVGSIENKKVLIIGAGGAARGIYISLLRRGIKAVDITNRTLQKAQTLIDQTSIQNESSAITLFQAEDTLHHYNIIINTTSVGMSPNTEDVPLSLENMKKDTILSDIIYNPLETKWLKIGKEKGGIIHNGVGMFVGQGALAFEIWTDMKPNIERMEQIVIKQLGGY